MHRSRNICTQIKSHTLNCHDTFSIQIHAPPVHAHTYRNMQTNSWKVPSVLGTSLPARSTAPWAWLAFTNGPALDILHGKANWIPHIFTHLCCYYKHSISDYKDDVSAQIRSSAGSFCSSTFVPAISPSVSARSRFVLITHSCDAAVILGGFLEIFWAFSFLPHHPPCAAPLKDQSQRHMSPFMKDLTFVYLTPHLFINSVCFNWKFG